MRRPTLSSASRARAALLLAGALLCAAPALAPRAARSQEPPLEPLRRPVTVFVLEKPTVTVSFNGDFGPAQLTGVLESTPAAPLLVRGPEGTAREAAWGELRQLASVVRPAEGAERGWMATLMGDPVPVRTSQGAGRVSGFYEQSGWHVPVLPAGEIRLAGKPYGTVTLPTAKIVMLRQEPIRGTVTALPDAPLRVQVFDGKPFTVSLADVVTYRRDLHRQVVSLTLADDQSFTARLLELPRVSVPLAGADETVRNVPVEQIGLLERAVPGGRLLY